MGFGSGYDLGHDLGFIRCLVGKHGFPGNVSDGENRRIGRSCLRIRLYKALYGDGEKAIDEEDLRKLLKKRRTENVFSLSTALSNKNLKGSLRILKELERNREDPLSILYMIAWRFRQIFKVSQFLKEGKSDEGIAKAIKTSRGAIFYLKKSVRNFRENDLGRILGLIEQTDYGIKNSSGDNYILLEKLILGICARET